MIWRLLLLSVSLLITLCQGYPFFMKLIPNANRVKHPCLFFFPWPGVGHVNAFGGIAKNPFGEDFEAAGFKWTKELCETDSDGDGKTNGQELGDPDCEWSPGKTPRRRILITHPGYKRFDPEGCFCPYQVFCPFNSKGKSNLITVRNESERQEQQQKIQQEQEQQEQRQEQQQQQQQQQQEQRQEQQQQQRQRQEQQQQQQQEQQQQQPPEQEQHERQGQQQQEQEQQQQRQQEHEQKQ